MKTWAWVIWRATLSILQSRAVRKLAILVCSFTEGIGSSPSARNRHRLGNSSPCHHQLLRFRDPEECGFPTTPQTPETAAPALSSAWSSFPASLLFDLGFEGFDLGEVLLVGFGGVELFPAGVELGVEGVDFLLHRFVADAAFPAEQGLDRMDEVRVDVSDRTQSSRHIPCAVH